MAQHFTKGRRRRLRARGLGELLNDRTFFVYEETGGYVHASPFCRSADPRNVADEPVARVLNWRDLTCACWPHEDQLNGANLGVLNAPLHLLKIEEALQVAEASSEDGTPEGRAAYQNATNWDLSVAEQLRVPKLIGAYEQWVQELEDRENALVRARQDQGQRLYRNNQIRQCAIGSVRDQIAKAYGTLGVGFERVIVRQLIEMWVHDHSAGRTDTVRRINRSAGRIAQDAGVSPERIGRLTALWLPEAERLLPARIQEIWNGEWDVVVYGQALRAQPLLQAFTLQENHGHTLAALPRELRKRLSNSGQTWVRCTPLSSTGAQDDLQETIGVLWERDFLAQEGSLKKIVGVAEKIFV